MWDAVREMIDPRTPPTWAEHHHETLTYAGLHAMPQHAVVGLLLGDTDASDPLDGLLKRDAFQRACVDLARRSGNAVSGRIGSHGVALLFANATRAKLVDVAHKAAVTARRFGLALHAGISLPEAPAVLSTRYETALHAAEKALSERLAIVFGEPRPERSARRVRVLRDQLAHGAGESPGVLSPRFDQYIESVVVHCGYRIEPVRAQLEIGLQKLVEPLLQTGALDERAFDDMCIALENSANDASTVSAVSGLYRRLVSDIASVLLSPIRARQQRGIEGGLRFIREHLSEPLSLARVARASGFASGYFSKLFRREQNVPFESYVRQLRIERAKQMLADTTLSVERVRRLSGFQTRSLFFRAFHESTGVTPQAFRRH
jgi:AraC-like DNA-binding protein